MPELSLVIPVFNESQNISPLLEAVRAALKGIDYEVVLVNDGSADDTASEILKHTDERTLLVDLEKNYGQGPAMRAGTERSSGEYIAFIDGDLQNDPADIPAMLQLVKEGKAAIVMGNREKRQDGFLFRKIPSYIANGLIRLLTGIYIKDYGCTLRVFKRKYAIGLKLYEGLHRFIPVISVLQGAEILQIPVKHHPRIHGQSKYGLGRTFSVLRDLLLMTALKRIPVTNRRMAAPAGVICLLLGLVTLLTLKLFVQGHDPMSNDPFYYPAIILICTGIILIAVKLFLLKIIKEHHRKAAIQPYLIKEIWKGNNLM